MTHYHVEYSLLFCIHGFNIYLESEQKFLQSISLNQELKIKSCLKEDVWGFHQGKLTVKMSSERCIGKKGERGKENAKDKGRRKRSICNVSSINLFG